MPAGAAVRLPKYDIDSSVTVIQFIILAWADTIHDFWSGLRMKKNQFNPAAAAIKPILLAMFKQSFAKGVIPIVGTPDQAAQAVIDLIYAKLTEDAAATPEEKDPRKIKILLSDIEDTIRDYFEDFTEILRRPDPSASASHTDIIEGRQNALEIREENDIFVITQGTRRVKLFNEVERRTIGNFMLDFLFGNHDMPMVKLTCDTAPAKVATIFSSFENVCALLTPQNFGDSATSSPDQMIGKGGTMYMFPSNVVFNSGGYERAGDPARFVSRRSVLTPQFEISYKNDGFDVKKPYGFKYVIRSLASGNIAEFTFDSSQRQGASLNYLLMAHLKMVELPAGSTAGAIRAALQTIPIQSGCMRVADIKNDALLLEIFTSVKANSSVWEEIKRLGDQDQCDGAAYFYRMGEYVVLVTIDRPCFLLARLLGIPSILHNKDKFTLSKNRLAETPLTDAEKAAFKQAKTEKFVSNYTPLYNSLRNSAPFLIRFIGSIPEIAAVAWPKKRAGDSGAIIMKEVLRLRLLDIKQYVIKILKNIYIIGGSFSAGRAPTLAELQAIPADFYTTPPPAWPELVPDAAHTASNEQYIRLVLNTFTDGGVDANVLIDLKRLMEANNPFDIMRDYDEFNFSLSDFTELLSSYNVTVGAINKVYRDDRPVDFINIIEEYNKHVATVCEGFLNKEDGKRAESAIVIPQSYPAPYTDRTLNENALAVADYETAKFDRKNFPGSDLTEIGRLESLIAAKKIVAGTQFKLAQGFLKTQVPCIRNPDAPAPLSCVQAGGSFQSGGAEIIARVADLFTIICREAAAFVNQIYSTIDVGGFEGYIVKQFCNSIIFNRSVSHILNSADAVRSIVSDADTVKWIQHLAAQAAIPKLIERGRRLEAAPGTTALQIRLAQEEALNIQAKIAELRNNLIEGGAQGPDVVSLRESVPVNVSTSADFINYLALSDYDDFALSLLTKWEEGLELIDQETDEDVRGLLRSDDSGRGVGTASCIGVLLDPFTTRVEGISQTREYILLDLVAAHPFNRIPDRWIALGREGRTIDDILKTVLPNMLVTLAFVNDIIEGNVGANTSYFSNMILQGRTVPGRLSTYNISTVEGWRSLAGILHTVSWALTGAGGLAPEVLGLSRGGARRTRNNKSKGARTTRRR